jgi:hypothetical protein
VIQPGLGINSSTAAGITVLQLLLRAQVEPPTCSARTQPARAPGTVAGIQLPPVAQVLYPLRWVALVRWRRRLFALLRLGQSGTAVQMTSPGPLPPEPGLCPAALCLHRPRCWHHQRWWAAGRWRVRCHLLHQHLCRTLHATSAVRVSSKCSWFAEPTESLLLTTQPVLERVRHRPLLWLRGLHCIGCPAYRSIWVQL